MESSSYLCDPDDKIVLILSHFWTPINITTAKEGVRKLICSDNVQSLSGSGEPLSWNEWINPERACYYQNQPFLNSTKRLFPIPTIILTNAKWIYQSKRKPSLKYLYQRYNGVCQICGEHFGIRDMSIEHVYPKSKGGTKDSYNVTITCKTCNCKKGTFYPYKNYKGEDLKGFRPLPFFHAFVRERPEWQNFLFKS